MKRILLLVFSMIPFLSSAQIVVLSDSFDTYTAGLPLAANSPLWTTWSGGIPAEDANVDSTHSSSPPNSVYIIGNNGPTDLILPFPANYTTGVYELTLKIYIVAGKGGYFNCQGSMTPGVNWMLEVYFDNVGNGTLSAGGAASSGFTYVPDTWTDVRVHVDLTNDLADCYVNNALIQTWAWSLGSDGAGAPVSWGGIDIYASATTPPGDGEFYVDDVVLTDLTPLTSVNNATPFSGVSVSPNPSNGNFELVYYSNFSSDATLQLVNVAGEVIMERKEHIVSGKNSYLNDAALPAGAYFLRVVTEDKMITRKIFIE
jgi:hypothetical protein